jgi:hypothetical protein
MGRADKNEERAARRRRKENVGIFRRLVMARAVEILAFIGPGAIAMGPAGNQRKVVLRKWDELLLELRRRSKRGGWRNGQGIEIKQEVEDVS